MVTIITKIIQKLKLKLIIIKQTKLWYLFLRFFFIPIFDFIWVNIVNLQGRLLALIYLFNKKNFYKIDKYEDSKLIQDSPEFKQIAKKVKNAINDDFINKLIGELKLKKEIDSSKNQFDDYRISFFPLLPDDVKDEIIKFALSEKNLVTATRYLKVLPVIKKLNVSLNIPVGNKVKGAQLWHKDDFGYKSLDIFLAISDINLNNGPISFHKTKNKLGVFFKIKNVIKSALPGERNKVTLEEFSKHFNQQEIGTLIGKSGTGIFIDSFTKYHKGGHCNSENRLILRVSYQTPDCSRDLKVDEFEEFPGHPKIKKKDIKNIFHKYILFKHRNKFLSFIKIDQLNLFLIKIFHYKR